MPDGHWSGRRLLITGGAGFIGSNLAIRLAGAGAQVLIADSFHPGQGGNTRNLAPLAGKVRVVVGDLRRRAMAEALVEGCDTVFNLAGQSGHQDSMEDPLSDLAGNCEAQISILEACRRINPAVRVVFASTRQVYGRPRELPVSECHPTVPVDINGVHKLAAEEYHRLYHEVHGLRTSRLRLTNTIGPRMRVKDARLNFFGLWVRTILEGKPIEVWGGGQQRDFNDVEDVVDALLLAGSSDRADGKVYNLGAGRMVTLEELARLLAVANGAGGHRVTAFPEERRRIDIGDYRGDHSRITRELGWKPRRSLEDTLGRTLDYFRNELNHYL